mmetsp:Transcript_23120/g.50573  ORF Transcript_23120/g.50573 Transcript_23120/m.50573 type:complete len:298 (-) Transcript_23120:950-1843(-)
MLDLKSIYKLGKLSRNVGKARSLLNFAHARGRHAFERLSHCAALHALGQLQDKAAEGTHLDRLHCVRRQSLVAERGAKVAQLRLAMACHLRRKRGGLRKRLSSHNTDGELGRCLPAQSLEPASTLRGHRLCQAPQACTAQLAVPIECEARHRVVRVEVAVCEAERMQVRAGGGDAGQRARSEGRREGRAGHVGVARARGEVGRVAERAVAAEQLLHEPERLVHDAQHAARVGVAHRACGVDFVDRVAVGDAGGSVKELDGNGGRVGRGAPRGAAHGAAGAAAELLVQLQLRQPHRTR